jgi:ABC-type polysaccharide/polyol phosphate export permease
VLFYFKLFAVYISDIENIWSFASKLIWFGTPIFYSVEGQQNLFYLNLLNPMYYYITVSRDFLIYQKVSDFWLIGGCIIYSLLFLIFGFFIFKKLKHKFAEMI